MTWRARNGDLAGAVRHRAGRWCRGNGRFPYTGMTGGPARIIASANGCTGLPPNPWSLGGLGQSSQMSLASVIVANPCRVRSGLAVPLIVIILLSW